MDDIVDDLGCRCGYYLMIWNWRTAWEVRERGELGEEGISDGVVEVPIVVEEIMLEVAVA